MSQEYDDFGWGDEDKDKERERRKGWPEEMGGANGRLVLKFGFQGAFKTVVVYGGPFSNAPLNHENTYTLCLRAEKNVVGATGWLPIKDFGVPEDRDIVGFCLMAAFNAALCRKGVYVGCAGGIGRTGLFLSLMAKVAGYSRPVEYVREIYLPGAVETPKQERYIENFDVSGLRTYVRRSAWQSRFGLLTSITK